MDTWITSQLDVSFSLINDTEHGIIRRLVINKPLYFEGYYIGK